MTRETTKGVQLASGETGSSFLHRVLRETVGQFRGELGDAGLPERAAAFKDTFGDAVTRFEAARIASPRRVEIARHLDSLTRAAMAFDGAPLDEALQEAVPAPSLQVHEGSAKGWELEVPLDGAVYRGRHVQEAFDALLEAHHLTRAAHAALSWLLRYTGGTLDLTGHRFALLGAAAELSPAELLLKAGATVRWLDVKPPAVSLGRLHTTMGGDDVLHEPRKVVAALKAFASEGPAHVGLFAYAPGAGRELRLAAAMDAIVRAAGPSVVKSVSLYVSPTSPGELQPEDVAVADARARAPTWWQRGFTVAGALKGPGRSGTGSAAVARGPISLQGAAYQAAQYLTKLIASEVLAVDGLGGAPLTVSANVAGITETRSLSHPLFQLAFKGAPAFGVRIFRPETTRALSGMLLVHDLLNPDAPGAASTVVPGQEASKARALRSQQLHGGAYDLPWQFESAVRTAAVIGLSTRPDVLFRRARAG
jgi:hypothetical protein